MSRVTTSPSVLLLDFGAVISRSLFETVADIEERFGIETGSLDWFGPLNTGNDPLWERMRSGAISERDYWYTRAEELSALCGKALGIQDIINHTRPQIDAVCRPEAVHAIDTVKASGGTVAVLTNELLLFYGSDRVNASSVLHQIDHSFDASYTNILKPDPRAYAMVTAGLGVEPQEIVFVDDQIKNVDGGNRAGFHSIHLELNHPEKAFNAALNAMDLTPQ